MRQRSAPPTTVNMEPIEASLAAIDSLAPGESISYTEIAKKYGVVRSTLARRHQAITRTRADEGINRRKLSPQQEKELISYIKRPTERGLPPTRAIIQNFAGSIARTSVSLYLNRWVGFRNCFRWPWVFNAVKNTWV